MFSVNRDSISSLDIYQRILRHRNYFVALVHKVSRPFFTVQLSATFSSPPPLFQSLLPPQIRLPFVGSVHYLSSGLRFNIEWLLFWGPWSPWKSSYALKDEFKERDNLERIGKGKAATKLQLPTRQIQLEICKWICWWWVSSTWSFFRLSSFTKCCSAFSLTPNIFNGIATFWACANTPITDGIIYFSIFNWLHSSF